MGVFPGLPLGDEGIQSSSIEPQTQEKQSSITHSLKGVHFAGNIGDVGVVAYLLNKKLQEGGLLISQKTPW